MSSKYRVFYRRMIWIPMEVEAGSKDEAVDDVETKMTAMQDALTYEDSSNTEWEVDRENVEKVE